MTRHLHNLTVVSVLFCLSLLASIGLFWLLDSQAQIAGKNWSAGGAIAGFILLYFLGDKTFRALHNRNPVLTGAQTQVLIRLYTDSIKHQMVLQAFSWIDDKERNQQLPDVKSRMETLDGIRHRIRQDLTCFATPFKDLIKVTDEKWGLEFTLRNVGQALEIMDSPLPSDQKRHRILEIADSIQHRTMQEYVKDLKALGAL